jgi:hypothetical protein
MNTFLLCIFTHQSFKQNTLHIHFFTCSLLASHIKSVPVLNCVGSTGHAHLLWHDWRNANTLVPSQDKSPCALGVQTSVGLGFRESRRLGFNAAHSVSNHES